MPGDAVHFASFAFGESPHSTVPFSSGEAICNNTSGIETMERERKPPLSLPWRQRRRKKKKRRNPSWAARMRRAFTASRLPELGGSRCHTEPHNAVRGTMRALWEGYNPHKHPCDRYCGQTSSLCMREESSAGQRAAWGETCARYYNWSLAAVPLDAPQGRRQRQQLHMLAPNLSSVRI